MTVYVDDMRAKFRRMIMCHMIADTDAELHAMADRIGVARKWHEAPPEHDSHYDIALNKRALAVRFGAQEITWHDCAMMTVLRRSGQRRDPAARSHCRDGPVSGDPGGYERTRRLLLIRYAVSV